MSEGLTLSGKEEGREGGREIGGGSKGECKLQHSQCRGMSHCGVYQLFSVSITSCAIVSVYHHEWPGWGRLGKADSHTVLAITTVLTM